MTSERLTSRKTQTVSCGVPEFLKEGNPYQSSADIDGDANPADNTTLVCNAYILTPETESIVISGSQEGELGVAPIYFGCHETATQTIYLANEIGSDCGEIQSMEFISIFNNENQTDSFEVFIAETDREDFSDNGWVAE